MTILLFYLYLCHLLEFNSHLTGERRSTEMANDNSSSIDKQYNYNYEIKIQFTL